MKRYLILMLAFSSFTICFPFGGCRNGNVKKQEPQKLSEEEQRLSENAIKGLKIRDGLYATLFASEPMITNPTNMDIDSRGRVWVCEAYNYRPDLNPGHPVNNKGDKILILEDLDGDGIADTSKVFYQGNDVNAALGICVLGNKVIVSCSPKVLVLTDTDGDDEADKKEILFEGVGGEQHDHGIHAFTFGPDGKLYFNFGNAGDSILDKNGRIVRDIEGIPINNHGNPFRQGMAFRSDLDGENVEVLGNNFRNPYEIAVDAFGNLWQSDNDDDGNRGVRINYVMEHGNYGYTDEMTGASWRNSRINMEDSIPLQHWHLNDPGVIPNLLQTGAGAPTGMVVYEGRLLPQTFQDQIIHADALPNIVRSYPTQKNGAGFSATIVNLVEGVYDKWFRPSDVCVAPDGSLFISDWYDPGVGGHQVADLQKGRIYRIAPPDTKYKVHPIEVKDGKSAIEALKSPNLATRYLGWIKLNEMGDEAVPDLDKLFKTNDPRFKARALWLLSKLKDGPGYIFSALKDQNEDIRITAIRAARENGMNILPVVQQVVDDPSVQVRRTAAIALWHNPSDNAAILWSELARQYDGKDRWYLEALGIGADQQWDRCLSAWLKSVDNEWNTRAGRDIIWRARMNKIALPFLGNIIEDPKIDPEKNLKFFRAFDFYSGKEKDNVLISLLDGQHPKQGFIDAMSLLLLSPGSAKRLPDFQAILNKSLTSVRGRRIFVDLVSKYQINSKNQELLDLILTSPSPDLRNYAMETLLNTKDGAAYLSKQLEDAPASVESLIITLGNNETKKAKDVLEVLVLNKNLPLDDRKLATTALGKGWSGENRLIDLIEKKILPSDVDQEAKVILAKASREEIRNKANNYFGGNTGNDNLEKLPSIENLSEQNGDITKGLAVFQDYCSSCHRVDNIGTDFGPNLSAIGGKLAKEAIYKAIITPDAGISFGFEGYIFKLKDEREILGYISNETSNEVDVKTIGGAIQKIEKNEILSKKGYEHSLMPTGLASSMGKDKLVDLVEYLHSLK